jgi:hypothetical protein
MHAPLRAELGVAVETQNGLYGTRTINSWLGTLKQETGGVD